jgi:hypothetical protein
MSARVVLVLIDGLGDVSVPSLGFRTLLQATPTPTLGVGNGGLLSPKARVGGSAQRASRFLTLQIPSGFGFQSLFGAPKPTSGLSHCLFRPAQLITGVKGGPG